MISPMILGKSHYIDEDTVSPFTVGLVDTDKGFIHVFDDFSISIVMQELDTTSDFANYLKCRERLFCSGKLISATGEEELLAYYLTRTNSSGMHDFVIPSEYTHISFDIGFWDDYIHSDSRLRKITENEVSYSWDKLIEKFSINIMNRSLYKINDGYLSQHYDEAVRKMASECRIRRRMLAKALCDFISNSIPNMRQARLVLSSSQPGLYYIFLILDNTFDSINEYRINRRNLLELYCKATKVRHPDALDVVGIATESSTVINRSEDAVWFHCSKVDDDFVQHIEPLMKLGNIFEALGKPIKVNVKEYPDSSLSQSSQAHSMNKNTQSRRNTTCPCGSGKKFKRCCM